MKIFYNGNIYTNNKKTFVKAMLIKDGIITNIGTNKEILKFKTANTELYNLNNHTVIPGFIDSHLHLYNTGVMLQSINLRDKKSSEEIKTSLNNYLQEHPNTTMIMGHGWDQENFPNKQLLTKKDLDQMVTNIPIILYRVCGHLLVANSKALELANITHKTESYENSFIDFENGILYEGAINLLIQKLPEPSVEMIKTTIQKTINYANSLGLTSLHTDDFGANSVTNYSKVIQAYSELAKDNLLNARIYQQMLLPNSEILNDFLNNNFREDTYNDYYKLGPLKLLLDGSLGARTAALIKPYYDDKLNKGILNYSDQELFELIKTAHIANMQIVFHAIGDRAILQGLSVLKKIIKKYPKSDHRHGIVHAQITNRKIIALMKKLNVFVITQPIFINSDHKFLFDRVGTKRAKWSYLFNTFLKNNIPVALGTDSPIENLNPFYNIYTAITRQDLLNESSGINIFEAVDIYQAIDHYTYLNAQLSFEENIKGKLIPQYFADFIILNQNIFDVEPTKLKNTKVLATYVGGKKVY